MEYPFFWATLDTAALDVPGLPAPRDLCELDEALIGTRCPEFVYGSIQCAGDGGLTDALPTGYFAYGHQSDVR